MLIRFSIENWMSFRDKATFSMIASRERQHSERVPRIDGFNMRVLPVAAIYGGNASGKTNLFHAINFAKKLVLKGSQPNSLIPVEPFRLEENYLQQPSRFCFELLINDTVYEFSFAVTRREVLEEKLVLLHSASEKVLYDRKADSPEPEQRFKEDERLLYAFKGTRENQLFLTNSVHQKIDTFKPVYDWFDDTLELIAPDDRFAPFEQFINEKHPLYAKMNAMLASLDTGIAHIGGEAVSLQRLPIPDEVKKELIEMIKEGESAQISGDAGNERLLVTRDKDGLRAKKLFSYHMGNKGKDVQFEIKHESDGSRRVIDLLPAFLDLRESSTIKVYVIDEVDRSLHTLLTRRLLLLFLESCSPQSRSQLLFTTHDVLLMDQELFRRDEMWVAERDHTGASSLFSFSDYKDIRYDKDIRKSYLQGRLGGVPRILLAQPLTEASSSSGAGEAQ